MVKLDVRVGVDAPIPQVVEYICALEDAGVDGVGIPEHPEGGREQFVALTAAALKTHRITLWPALATPFARHPAIIAGGVQTLEELAPGRIRLCVGSGDSSSRYLGVRQQTVAEMRAVVRNIKSLLHGQEVKFAGEDKPGIKFSHVLSAPPPVFLAADGPRMMENAAAEADGVLVRSGLHPALVSKAKENVRQGALKAGKDPDTIKVIFATQFVMAKTDKEARERARARCFSLIQRPSRAATLGNAFQGPSLQELGISIPPVTKAADIPDGVLAEICDATGIIGSPEHCLEIIARTAKTSGVEHIFCTGYGVDNMSLVALEGLRRVVLPGIRRL